jgi:hypothetical protein
MNTAQSATEFRVKRCVNRFDPLRDGSEKDEAFLSGARPAKVITLQMIAA